METQNKLSDQVRRKFIQSLKGKNFKVKTDTGWSPIKYLHKTVEYVEWKLVTKHNELTCADTHIVFRTNELNEVLDEVYVKDLVPGDLIHSDSGPDEVVSVSETDKSSNMYDLELDDENHRFFTNGILSHNSATTRGFIIWYMLFNKQKTIAILANKLQLAQEQLTQLKESYLELPFWMQPGVRSWNKRGIELSHGTRIISAATSPDGIRGYSIDVLYLDEFAFIDSHVADEFIASVFPVVSSGKTTKIVITSTPNGMNHFHEMWQEALDEYDEVAHNAESSKFVPVEVPWNAVPGRTDEWAMEQRKLIGEIRFTQEYQCAFIGSVSTLIDATVLQKLSKVPPLNLPNMPETVKIWDLPVPKAKLDTNNWEYVASLDTGMGLHKDYTVLQIFLIKSNIEVIQVAKIASNKMEIDSFCKLSDQVLRAFHQPSLIIEQNGVGQVSINWFYNNGYDNLLHFSTKGNIMGLVSSKPLKAQACVTFKTYIEKELMKLRDAHTIKELMSFGKKGKDTWEGLSGANDDHVLACIWVAYYVDSPMFYGNVIEEDITKLEDQSGMLKSLGYEGEDVRVIQDAKQNFNKYHDEASMYSDNVNIYREDDEDDDGEGAGVIVRT
jgi:hypothetical protein